ncbi:MAG: 30S ribosomal protein S16 [Candidatus Portnoybacteria bacterium CG_4_8_14_3_um_filter_44_15]|uniref:Small ribosomal subunit protein bS16 n=4 Tax=Candidatus Portnoyibacteriota TaxID=1817913 RepID=A0A2M7YMF0_9BACT|nr:MAG: 30S ribosomal protein S16 [Parcubacteria group bacterium CG1_02_44_65]PIP15627.1 MAG: 30S ribosomal protein S16 [Candidatus Portnoybacteria bacterium CG23_combo_of_CG06-09_8_20_14_all_44_36]PIW74796.1 MAG: 30S ribosomal protein S16 [Candidatus Portnoybacteria bacterium CG_4_8_14_3_um_filter_44_15]PIZ69555.1 MAG: 30S ribosomal protein S16 [Candidatus Portnoybacteria bacterium CG_4_10_14_0_2_um_filter_43_36]PJA64164.1 MAG: 30S ribosomal protein S16 [Candidatus Portnoybacteria bacterium CG
MLVIRLIRVGKKNSPSFRVILTEKTAAAKSGSFLEILGHYNPRLVKKENGKSKKEIKLDGARIKYWLSQGAQASATVHNLLVAEKVIAGEKIKKKIKAQKDEKKEKPKEEKTAPEAESAEKASELPAAGAEEKTAAVSKPAKQPKGEEKPKPVDKPENKE